MLPSDPKVKEGTRVVFEFWSAAPYSADEKHALREDMIAAANEFDSDIIAGSFEIRVEDRAEIAKTNKKMIIAMLDEANIGAIINFGEDVDGLEYVSGTDND